MGGDIGNGVLNLFYGNLYVKNKIDIAILV